MKKDGRDMKYVNYLCVWCLAMVLFACQEESLEQSGKTGFLVSLTDGTEVAVSRATPGELKESLPIEAKDFDLTITGSSTGETAYSGKVSEGLIPVKAGVYNLTATYGENPVLALDAPYFKGEMEKAIVKGGETTSVEIPCKVANSLLSVTFDNSKESFEDIYSDYSVEVKVGEESVTLKKDGKESAYFRADSGIEVIFHGTLKEDEGVKTVSLDLSGIKELPLQAGDHLKLTLMPELDKYDIPLSVTAAEVVTVTLEETIPVSWLPKPKVSAEGFDENNTLTFVETEAKTARLNLGLSSALQDMKLKFNFEDEQFSSLQKDKEYLLSNAEDKAAVEAALGITLPEIGTTEAGIDLSGVVSRMQTDAGATVNNTIEVDVKANDRWSSEDENANRIYKLVCNKPEFSVNVKPENCWSREFTVDEVQITGNADVEKIKADLVYQYFDGTNWVNCTTRDNVIGRTQQFVEAAKDIVTKTYKVRALYRGAIASEEVEAVLETPEQLPNSGMEEWYYDMAARNIPIYYPWKNNGTSFWNTNNTYTTRYHATINIFNSGSNPYNCFPAVSYIVGGHSGDKAVELRNTASGRGNTLPSNVLDLNKVAGELFTGDVTVVTGGTAAIPDGDHYTIDTNGRSFSSRPTSMEFWYKYVPTNSDTWQAKIVLMDSEHNVIVEQNLQKSGIQNTWDKATVKLQYVNGQEYAKCQYIYVVFSSTIITGKEMQWESHNSYILWEDQLQVTFDDTKCWVGSVFTIDDISLVYDK